MGAMQPQKLGKATNKLSAGASEGAEPARFHSPGFRAERVHRWFLSHQVFGHLLQQPQEINTMLILQTENSGARVDKPWSSWGPVGG